MTDDASDSLPVFVALDFETANRSPRSAVAVALVRVVGGILERTAASLLRPPTRRFSFSQLHGIRATDVVDAPDFSTAWRRLCGLLDGVRFVAAHHAAFDQSVLNACCSHAKIAAPRLPILCTVALARAAWGLFPTKLPNVCQHLGLPLQHHDAAADAEACARIVCAGWNTTVGRRWIRDFARI